MTMVARTDGATDNLASLMSENPLRSVYQPIVCLDRLAPVGVEALVRGPVGTRWEFPDVLFGAARAEGRVTDLTRDQLRPLRDPTHPQAYGRSCSITTQTPVLPIRRP